MAFWRRHPILGATLLYVALTVGLTGRALVGKGSMAPDAELDSETLFKLTNFPPPYQLVNDLTPIQLDLPRDLPLAKALHRGRFDVWNPLAACGGPLWAEQGGPFYPLKAAYYILPTDVGYNWFRALRLLFAAIGAFLLARRRGLSFESSWFAGALFELSGVVIGWTPFGNTAALYTMPWVILGAQAIADQRNGRAAIGAGVALALTLSGGHPALGLVVFFAFGLAIAGHMLVRPRDALQLAKLSAVSGAIGVLLAAPTLLPLVELYANGQTYKNAASGAVIWQTALRDLNPTIPAAQLMPRVLMELRPLVGNLYPHAFTSSIGVIATMLAIAGLFSRRPDPSQLLMMIVGLGLATQLPGLVWLHKLPGVKFVLPHYYWPMVALPATQLAAAGLPRAGAVRRWMPAVGAIALAAALFFWKRHGTVLQKWSFPSLTSKAASVAFLPWKIYVPIVVAGVLALAWLVLARTRAARVVTLLAGVLAVGEAFYSMAPFLQDVRSPALKRPPSPAVQFLADHMRDGLSRFIAVPYNIATPHLPRLFGLNDFRGNGPLPVGRFAKYRELIDTRVPYPTIHTVERTASALLDLAAVRWVAVPRRNFRAEVPQLLDKDEQMPLAYADERIVIFENRAAVPRAFLTHKAVVRPNLNLAAQALWDRARGERHIDKTTLLDEVIIDPNVNDERPADLDGPQVTMDEWVRITSASRPDRVELEASLESPGFVVLADTYYPGWEAKVDGKRVPVFPADLAFRAVYVDAGPHRIEFRYQPEQLRLGLALMMLTLVLILAWWREFSSPAARG
jgi:hypothetical protein